MFEVVLTKKAEENYISICDYLLTYYTLDIVLKFDAIIDNTVEQLKRNPNSFILFDADRKIRKVLLHPHIHIFFTVVNNKVYILSFFDNRQNPDKLNLI